MLNLQSVIRQIWPPACAPKRLQSLLGVSFETAKKYYYRDVAISIRREVLEKLVMVIDEKIASLKLVRAQIMIELGEKNIEKTKGEDLAGDLPPRGISAVTWNLDITIGGMDTWRQNFARYISSVCESVGQLPQCEMSIKV